MEKKEKDGVGRRKMRRRRRSRRRRRRRKRRKRRMRKRRSGKEGERISWKKKYVKKEKKEKLFKTRIKFTTKITTLGQENTRQNKKWGGGTGNWGDKMKRLNGLKGGGMAL